jgi:hypothetical protein
MPVTGSTIGFLSLWPKGSYRQATRWKGKTIVGPKKRKKKKEKADLLAIIGWSREAANR